MQSQPLLDAPHEGMDPDVRGRILRTVLSIVHEVLGRGDMRVRPHVPILQHDAAGAVGFHELFRR